MIDPAYIWAPAVGSVAYFTHRVAISWLNVRERAAVRLEERDEREKSAVATLKAQVEDAEARMRKVETEWKTFRLNNERR